ncbi:MAG: helix-turn-helix domain-containing protein [Legionella sp.]|nr:helix-turn-helix domain-containing protein [Legionella sp.]
MQIRAARVLLGLSQADLAARASIGLGTVKRIEAARVELTGTVQTLSRIKKALEAAGIAFIEQDEQQGPGVRLRKPLP